MQTSSPDLAELAEIVRIPSPAPLPQSLAYDGERLWVGSFETARVYALDPRRGVVADEGAVPGKPIGSTAVGDELRFVVSEGGEADNRFIRRYVPGHGFKSREAIACPDDTGSFLAFDGTHLWLSQRYRKRVLELDANFAPTRTLEVGEEIIGLAWVDERLYLSLWLGRERGGCRIAYLEPGADAGPMLVAGSPFVAVSLARDGERLWTNDFRRNELVAFALPRERG
ncbi:MAG: hypothetical protein ACREM2_01520 [Vulcanimicrobiaceae bacterium]